MSDLWPTVHTKNSHLITSERGLSSNRSEIFAVGTGANCFQTGPVQFPRETLWCGWQTGAGSCCGRPAHWCGVARARANTPPAVSTLSHEKYSVERNPVVSASTPTLFTIITINFSFISHQPLPGINPLNTSLPSRDYLIVSNLFLRYFNWYSSLWLCLF